jgi:outer membrane protein assembly factor BamB
LLRRAAAALAAVTLAAGCSGDDTGDAAPAAGEVEAPAGPVAPGDEVVPPEALEHAADWPLPGRDHANSRAATGSPITAATIDDLEVVWEAPIPGAGPYGSATTTPLVLGDLVLVQDLQSNVRAFDLATGETVWETLVDQFQIGPNGVAVGWGRVFATKGMEQVMALDLATGDELWSVELVDTPTAGIDIQPQVVAGLVLVSTVPISMDGFYTGGDRGVLHALDVETGEVVWRFDTVADEPGELWGDPAVNSGGGAWYPPAVDPEAGVVYWGIANPAPFPGTPEAPNGASRPGPNLYTESVVALDLHTGALRWHHQVFEHDLLDRDHVHTMLVGTDDGVVLVSTGKGGVVVGHDPTEGGERWRTAVGVHRNDDLDALDGPTEVWPGTFGGVITPPAHADGVVYVATLNAPTELAPDETAYLGSQLGTAPGEVAAVRATDGELLWSTEVPGDPLGGATVVGDLVLTATFQGTMLALRRDTGEIVWERDAGGGVNGWPAVAGDLLLWPVGMADPPVLVALGLDDG